LDARLRPAEFAVVVPPGVEDLVAEERKARYERQAIQRSE